MFEKALPRILEKYDLDYASIGRLQKGYRSESYPVTLIDSTKVNLIIFKNEPQILDKINRADYASGLLASRLPVRTRVDDRLLKLKQDTYAGIYTYLPGETVPWEAFTKKHIKLMGQAMADIHRIWSGKPPQDTHTIIDELIPLINRMENYFTDHEVAKAMSVKLNATLTNSDLNDYRKLVRMVATLPGQQIVHMDMVRGNVLFGVASENDAWQLNGLALTGLIDFEKSTIGHPLFDLARTIAFLLVDTPKSSTRIYKYFLDSGYVKRGGQPQPSPILLNYLIRFFLLHDFYKFLKHTPYESLHGNHHFNRTFEILVDYGMISAKS